MFINQINNLKSYKITKEFIIKLKKLKNIYLKMYKLRNLSKNLSNLIYMLDLIEFKNSFQSHQKYKIINKRGKKIKELFQL